MRDDSELWKDLADVVGSWAMIRGESWWRELHDDSERGAEGDGTEIR